MSRKKQIRPPSPIWKSKWALFGVLAVAAFTATYAALKGTEADRLKYEESVKAGKYLVIAHGTTEDVNKAKTSLQGTGAGELSAHNNSVAA